MKKIAIITSDKFPRGNAGATRQEALANLFALQGNKVDVIGLGETTLFEFISLDVGIRYISLRGIKKDLMHRIYDRIIFTYRVKKLLKRNDTYDIILIESIPNSSIKYIKKYYKKTNCILIHDSVEWYSASQFKFGKFNPAFIIKNRLNTRWITKDFNIIAISSFLENFFLNKGCKVVRIPFIHDVQSVQNIKKSNNDKIVFMYAGMMGKKDYLENFLRAINLLDRHQKKRITIHFFGFNREYLLKTSNLETDILESLKENIHIHGRVSRKIVEENLKQTHFTLLFRKSEERYAKAGFPTKVVESLMYSTPIFCNLSSDLDYYLKDSYNSIISESDNENDICKGLDRILSLSKEELHEMQVNARKTAVEYFDYRLYSNEINLISNMHKENELKKK